MTRCSLDRAGDPDGRERRDDHVRAPDGVAAHPGGAVGEVEHRRRVQEAAVRGTTNEPGRQRARARRSCRLAWLSIDALRACPWCRRCSRCRTGRRRPGRRRRTGGCSPIRPSTGEQALRRRVLARVQDVAHDGGRVADPGDAGRRTRRRRPGSPTAGVDQRERDLGRAPAGVHRGHDAARPRHGEQVLVVAVGVHARASRPGRRGRARAAGARRRSGPPGPRTPPTCGRGRRRSSRPGRGSRGWRDAGPASGTSDRSP